MSLSACNISVTNVLCNFDNIALAQHWQLWQGFINTCDPMLNADSKTFLPTWLMMVHSVWPVTRGVHSALTGNRFLRKSLFLGRGPGRAWDLKFGSWDLRLFWLIGASSRLSQCFSLCSVVLFFICDLSLFLGCWRFFG